MKWLYAIFIVAYVSQMARIVWHVCRIGREIDSARTKR